MKSDKPTSQAQTQLLLTILIIVIVFILLLIVILAAYPSLLAPAPTITPTITLTKTVTPTISLTPTITPSPTHTRTLRPTLTPSVTNTPTRTLIPSSTPTPPGPATLTPAAPFGDEKNYRLQKWVVDRATQLVNLFFDYPNTLTENERGSDNANYNAAFYYSYIALSEALLRFPEQVSSTKWSWQLAYSLARLGDMRAAQTYGDLIAAGLNSGKTRMGTLANWFNSNEPHLTLEYNPLQALPQSLNSYIIQIKDQGSAFILLVETSGAYKSFALASNFTYETTTSSNLTATPQSIPNETIEYDSLSSDLTGDGAAEIIIYAKNSAQTSLELPRIFQANEYPPKEIFFDQANGPFTIGMQHQNTWISLKHEGKSVLQSITKLFPACPLEIQRDYAWNGSVLEVLLTEYHVKPYPETMNYCSYLIEHAINVWGPNATIAIMEELLPNWPPAKMENGKPYPLDAKDEWRYRLGIYHAQVGNEITAKKYLNELVSTPSSPSSRWILPARKFLEIYQKPEDIYDACIIAQLCNPTYVISYLINQISSERYPDLIASLIQQGISLRAYGYFDFDGDDVRDIWFTVRHHPGEVLQLWFTLQYQDKIAAMVQDTLDTDTPSLIYYDDKIRPPIVLMNNRYAFQIERVSGSRQPYLVEYQLPKVYPNRFSQALDKETDALLSGSNPKDIQKNLLELQKVPGLLCKANWSCDKYYYILGLASEISGDEPTAVFAYLRLWWDYWKSPYTIMARLKLRPLYLPTPSPTQTPTPTMTVPVPSATTPVPTAAFATPTPTHYTPSYATPTRTPAKTPTLTLGPGPYPGPTKKPSPYP